MHPDPKARHAPWPRHLAALLLLVVSGLATMASSQRTPAPGERLIEEPPARRAHPAPPERRVTYAPCPGPRGTIHRRHLLALLQKGPGLFLGGVDVSMVPAKALPPGALDVWPGMVPPGSGETGFGGWKVQRFHPGDPCLARADLRTGDVVVSVNDNRLRRPEDLMTLWTALAEAPRITVRLLRGHEPLTFVVEVSDPAP